MPHRTDDSFVTEMIDVMVKIEAKILQTPGIFLHVLYLKQSTQSFRERFNLKKNTPRIL